MEDFDLTLEIFELELQQHAIEDNWLKDRGLTIVDLRKPKNRDELRQCLQEHEEWNRLADEISLKEEERVKLQSLYDELREEIRLE